MSGPQFTTLTGAAATQRGDLRRRLSGLVWTAVAVTIFSGWFVVTHFSMTRELGIWDITALRSESGRYCSRQCCVGGESPFPKSPGLRDSCSPRCGACPSSYLSHSASPYLGRAGRVDRADLNAAVCGLIRLGFSPRASG